MRNRAGAALIFGVPCFIAAGLGTVRAEHDLTPSGVPQSLRSQAVVATVGSAEISVGAFEQRLAAVPDFQLATLGATPAEQKRHFLEQVMIREAILSEGARATAPRPEPGREGTNRRGASGSAHRRPAKRARGVARGNHHLLRPEPEPI